MANPQVTFDYARWIARYPEFYSVTEDVAQAYFDEATVYHRNDGTGPVCNDTEQLALLGMITAHIAAQYATINGAAPSPLVGRISNASEGSVSVAVEGFNNIPGTQQWWLTTKYGANYWAATAQFRGLRYRPGPSRFFGPIYPGYGTVWWRG